MEKENEKKGKKSVVSIVIDVLMGGVIAFLVFVMASMLITTQTSKYNVPSVFGHSFLYVATDSMAIDEAVSEDTCSVKKEASDQDRCYAQMKAEDVSGFAIGHFDKGAGVIITTVEPSEIEVGDVISFFYDALGALDTHRVKAILEPYQTFQYAPVGDEDNVITIVNTNNERLFITRGDNLHASLATEASGWPIGYFEEVPASVVVGKVIHASMGFGTFLSLVSPAVPNGYATVIYPLFVLVPLAIIGLISVIDIVKEVKRQKKEEAEALAAAMAEAGIDPEDERSAYAFTIKWQMKQELKEEREKEKAKIKKAIKADMKREIIKNRAVYSKTQSERDAEKARIKAEMKEQMRREREEARLKESNGEGTPVSKPVDAINIEANMQEAPKEPTEMSERERLKAEMKEQMRREREAAKAAEEAKKAEEAKPAPAPEMSERERLKAELKEQMRREREEAKKKEQTERKED